MQVRQPSSDFTQRASLDLTDVLPNRGVSGSTAGLRRWRILAVHALLVVASMAEAQAVNFQVFAAALNQASAQAVDYLARHSNSEDGAAIMLIPAAPLDRLAFCGVLKEQATGLYVAPLATLRSCLGPIGPLAAMDYPFLARDWGEARELLNGPIGLGIAEELQRRGLTVMSFWQGDARVLASKVLITQADDLKGRKVLIPPTYASSTTVAQAGATSSGVPVGEIYTSLERGLADTADLPLAIYQAAGVSKVLRDALLSNHSLDPYVVVAASSALRSLSGAQQGYLEGLVRRATKFQILTAQAAQASQISELRDAGANVSSMSDRTLASFRSTQPQNVALQRASQVFDQSPASLRTAAGAIYAGQAQASYFRVHFATNRAVRGTSFSNDKSDVVQYGRADIELEFDSELTMIGELLKSLTFGPKGRGVVVDWSSVGASPPAGPLDPVPPQMPSKALLVYVHGFANTFEDAIRRGAWLGWNAKRPVLVFAWPSRGVPLPADYRADQITADQSAHSLAEVLAQFGRAGTAGTDVDVVVHSMGVRVMLGALKQLNALGSGSALKFRQLILVAPDVASSELGSTWASLQPYFEKMTTLYVSDHDLALGISRRYMNPGEGSRAGLAPPVLTTAGVESIFIGPNEFSLTGHSYHVANGLIADDLMEALRYGVPAGDRRGIIPSPGGARYFQIRRLRSE